MVSHPFVCSEFFPSGLSSVHSLFIIELQSFLGQYNYITQTSPVKKFPFIDQQLKSNKRFLLIFPLSSSIWMTRLCSIQKYSMFVFLSLSSNTFEWNAHIAPQTSDAREVVKQTTHPPEIIIYGNLRKVASFLVLKVGSLYILFLIHSHVHFSWRQNVPHKIISRKTNFAFFTPPNCFNS